MRKEEPKNNIKRKMPTQHAIDRRSFHFKALWDTRRELIAHEDQGKIIDIYLLTAIGTLGITSGFVCWIDKEAHNNHVTSRGLEPGDIKTIEENIPKIIQLYFPESLPQNRPPPMEARLMTYEDLADPSLFPHQTRILIQWSINNQYLGLTGFGEKILAKTYDDEDLELLHSLTYNLMFAMHHALSTTIIRQLRLNLQQKNKDIEDALKQTERNKSDLDRRLFHLKSFYDIFHELSGLKDTNRIMETFLLLIMGTFSVGQSYILLLDQEEKTARMTCRGIENEKHGKLSQDQIDNLIRHCLEYAKVNNLAPMNARRLTDRNFWDNTFRPLEIKIELLFVINESCLGLIGLGNKITLQSFSEEELELLMTLVYNFMVFLENTRSFETIQRLNVDLEKRNIELNKTIENLTASKHKVEVLERAKVRVKSAIQKEMEKTRRMSVKDFLLILSVSLLLGLVFNFSNPGGITLIPQNWFRKTPAQIDVHWAKLKHDAGTALFVDARPVEFFRQSHIKGAANLPLALFDFVYMMNFGDLDTQREIIVYGRNISSRYDEEVLFKLVPRGHENVKVLPGGLTAWKENGYPLES